MPHSFGAVRYCRQGSPPISSPSDQKMNSPKPNRTPDVPTKVSSLQHREPSKVLLIKKNFLSYETVAGRTKTNRGHAPSSPPRQSSFRLIRRVARPLCDDRESTSRVERRKSRMRHRLRDRRARFVSGWFAWLEQKGRICHDPSALRVGPETRSAGETRPGSASPSYVRISTFSKFASTPQLKLWTSTFPTRSCQ